jgi:hypothetical protein
MRAVAEGRERGPYAYRLGRAKPSSAEIRLIKPGLILCGQDAGDADSIQIQKAVVAATDSTGEIAQAFFVDVADLEAAAVRILQRARRIRQIQRRQGARQITAVFCKRVAGLFDPFEKRTDGLFVIFERRRADQIVFLA